MTALKYLNFYIKSHSFSRFGDYVFPSSLIPKARIFPAAPIPDRSPVSQTNLSMMECQLIVGHMKLGDCVRTTSDNAQRLREFVKEIPDIKFLSRNLGEGKVGLWLVPKGFRAQRYSE